MKVFIRAHNRRRFVGKAMAFAMAVIFFFTSLPVVYSQTALELPKPGTLVGVSPAFVPPFLKGMVTNPDNPFRFDFIVDRGNSALKGYALKPESTKLAKYFLAALAIPDNELWVNLSPYEKNRIIPEALSQTELGRDLLSQDYILKQLGASLMYPESASGKLFWDRIYKKVKALRGKEQPVNTFNKIWIVPDRAVVYEDGPAAIIIQSHLKVMLEQDLLALPVKDNAASASVVREVILPIIEKEVNTGKNFALLRQIYQSMILATWYKRKLKESILSQVYSDQKNVAGISLSDKNIKEKIYAQYLESFRRGVFNYIKADDRSVLGVKARRKYFAGGFKDTLPQVLEICGSDTHRLVEAELAPTQPGSGYEMHSADIIDADAPVITASMANGFANGEVSDLLRRARPVEDEHRVKIQILDDIARAILWRIYPEQPAERERMREILGHYLYREDLTQFIALVNIICRDNLNWVDAAILTEATNFIASAKLWQFSPGEEVEVKAVQGVDKFFLGYGDRQHQQIFLADRFFGQGGWPDWQRLSRALLRTALETTEVRWGRDAAHHAEQEILGKEPILDHDIRYYVEGELSAASQVASKTILDAEEQGRLLPPSELGLAVTTLLMHGLDDRLRSPLESMSGLRFGLGFSARAASVSAMQRAAVVSAMSNQKIPPCRRLLALLSRFELVPTAMYREVFDILSLLVSAKQLSSEDKREVFNFIFDGERMPEAKEFLARYEFRDLVGIGNQGIIFKVYDKTRAQDVAVKFSFDGPGTDGALGEYKMLNHMLEAQEKTGGNPHIMKLYALTRWRHPAFSNHFTFFTVSEWLDEKVHIRHNGLEEMDREENFEAIEYLEAAVQYLEAILYCAANNIYPADQQLALQGDRRAIDIKLFDFGIGVFGKDNSAHGSILLSQQAGFIITALLKLYVFKSVNGENASDRLKPILRQLDILAAVTPRDAQWFDHRPIVYLMRAMVNRLLGNGIEANRDMSLFKGDHFDNGDLVVHNETLNRFAPGLALFEIAQAPAGKITPEIAVRETESYLRVLDYSREIRGSIIGYGTVHNFSLTLAAYLQVFLLAGLNDALSQKIKQKIIEHGDQWTIFHRACFKNGNYFMECVNTLIAGTGSRNDEGELQDMLIEVTVEWLNEHAVSSVVPAAAPGYTPPKVAPGGIDLDSRNLQLITQGRGVGFLPVTTAAIAPKELRNKKLTPFIFEIRDLPNLTALLENQVRQ